MVVLCTHVHAYMCVCAYSKTSSIYPEQRWKIFHNLHPLPHLISLLQMIWMQSKRFDWHPLLSQSLSSQSIFKQQYASFTYSQACVSTPPPHLLDTRMGSHRHTCTHTHTFMLMCIHTFTCMHAHMRAHTDAQSHMHIHKEQVCMHTCMHTHIKHTHTHKYTSWYPKRSQNIAMLIMMEKSFLYTYLDLHCAFNMDCHLCRVYAECAQEQSSCDTSACAWAQRNAAFSALGQLWTPLLDFQSRYFFIIKRVEGELLL